MGSSSNGIIMVDAFAAANAVEDTNLLVVPVRRNQEGHGLADELLCRITKKLLRARV
jgi:hypothetical protein